MPRAKQNWAEEIVQAAGPAIRPGADQELVDTLVERATTLRHLIAVSDKQAVQMIAATLPMDIIAECQLADRLHVNADQVRDMFYAVSQAAWAVGEIEGLQAYRH